MTRRRLLIHAALALLVVGVVSVRGVMPVVAQPTLQSAWVDGVTLKLIYGSGLNGGSEPAAMAYTVSVGWLYPGCR